MAPNPPWLPHTSYSYRCLKLKALPQVLQFLCCFIFGHKNKITRNSLTFAHGQDQSIFADDFGRHCPFINHQSNRQWAPDRPSFIRPNLSGHWATGVYCWNPRSLGPGAIIGVRWCFNTFSICRVVLGSIPNASISFSLICYPSVRPAGLSPSIATLPLTQRCLYLLCNHLVPLSIIDTRLNHPPELFGQRVVLLSWFRASPLLFSGLFIVPFLQKGFGEKRLKTPHCWIRFVC